MLIDDQVPLAAVERVGQRQRRSRSCRRRWGRRAGTRRSAGRGRSRSARAVRIRWAIASSAWAWPMTRSFSLSRRGRARSGSRRRPSCRPGCRSSRRRPRRRSARRRGPGSAAPRPGAPASSAAGAPRSSARSARLVDGSPPSAAWRAPRSRSRSAGISLDQLLLLVPAGLELGELAPRAAAELRLDLGRPLGRRRADARSRARGCRAPTSRCVDLPPAVLEAGGMARLADRHAGAGRVEQADRLVGQLPRRDVAARELDRRLDRLVEDADAVVLLEHRGEPAHHPDRRRSSSAPRP